jgi:hypothetical protein
MSDHCTYPYPNWQEAQPAFKTILAKVTGEEVELGCLVHCGYTALGFALSMSFPHEPHPDHGMESIGEFDGHAALAALADWDGQSRMAIDWKKLAKFLFEKILPLIPLFI